MHFRTYFYEIRRSLHLTISSSLKGLYHYHTALEEDGRDVDIAEEHFRQAADFYLDAAHLFPEDEEQRLRMVPSLI